MKVLIILGTNAEGKKEAVEEDFSSWEEAIERSPVGEFLIKGLDYNYFFFGEEKHLNLIISDSQGYIGSLKGRQAKERFDYLLNREERQKSL